MAGYTKLNLKNDVEDQAPNFGLEGKIEARMARVPWSSSSRASATSASRRTSVSPSDTGTRTRKRCTS